MGNFCINYMLILNVLNENYCGDLNRNGPHKLINLNPWSLGRSTILNDWKCELVKGSVSLGVGFEVSLLPLDPSVDLLATMPACMPPCSSPS